MGKRITVIDGHPDLDPAHFCHALANAYTAGALAAGHEVLGLALASLDILPLRSRDDWERHDLPPEIKNCQDAIGLAEHLVIIYPLWLGTMPALLKAFFEQVFRPGFAIKSGGRTLSPGLLKGKSARIIVTMGMPALVYRWYFRAHSLKSLERNILKFVGIGPIAETIIGRIEASPAARAAWLNKVRELGERGI